MVLWPNSVASFDILVTAGNGTDSAGYHIRGVIENNVAVSIVGAVSTVLGEEIAGWSVSAVAGAAPASLRILVTGSGVTPVRWVAHVRTVEVRL
jgi:hypothetical protein